MTIQQQESGWQLERSAAEDYERHLVPVFFAPWAEALLEQVEPRPGERLLDVACGTGVVARQAAPRVAPGGTVAGLDLNEGMLSVARAVSAGVEPPIEWHQGDAADMPIADGAYDVVTCQAALMFFPDPGAALAEMRRVLAPGGRLALSVPRPIRFWPGYVAFTAVLERHLGPEVGAGLRSPFAEWDVAALREMLVGAGLRDVWVRIAIGSARFASAEELLHHETASSPLAAVIAGMPDDTRGALVADLREAVADHTDDEGVVGACEMYVVSARA